MSVAIDLFKVSNYDLKMHLNRDCLENTLELCLKLPWGIGNLVLSANTIYSDLSSLPFYELAKLAQSTLRLDTVFQGRVLAFILSRLLIVLRFTYIF